MEETVTKVVKEDGTTDIITRKGDVTTISTTDKDGNLKSAQIIVAREGVLNTRKKIEEIVFTSEFKMKENRIEKLEEKPSNDFDKIVKKLFEKKCGKCTSCDHEKHDKKEDDLSR